MALEKKALVGLHGSPAIARSFIRLLTSHFEVEQVYDVKTMLASCERSCYGFYLMDLNFGIPGGSDITPAQRVYSLLQQQQVGDLERKFIGVSGAEDVVALAQQEGLPAILKTEFAEYFRRSFPR